MVNAQRIALEDAVVAALKSNLGSLVQTLKTYQGNWQRDLAQEEWRLPAVLVMLGQCRGEQVTARSYDLTQDLTILAVVRQLRGEEAARRQEGGVYEILATIRQALWHQDLGQDILPLALVKEETVRSTPELAVYAAHYRTAAVQDF